MTFKEYSNAQSHLPLNVIRANWGKIQKAVQSDLANRHGGAKGGLYKTAGKVNSDGQIKISHTRIVMATKAEIDAQRQKDSDSAARHDSKLAELAAMAVADGRIGLDLVALVKAKSEAKSDAAEAKSDAKSEAKPAKSDAAEAKPELTEAK